MTHSTVPIPKLRYPVHVEYGGQIYRAWKPFPIAVLDGTALLATDESHRQHILIYGPGNPATVVAP